MWVQARAELVHDEEPALAEPVNRRDRQREPGEGPIALVVHAERLSTVAVVELQAPDHRLDRGFGQV